MSFFLQSLKYNPALSSEPVFFAWKELALANAKLFEADPLHNLSVAGHPMAERFAAYLEPHLHGEVLDIGCGPTRTRIPIYLDGVEGVNLTGIDPLIVEAEGPPFITIASTAERMPFIAQSFDVAVAATSLDHMLNLSAALLETRRVLVLGGLLVAWVRYWPGAPVYEPFSVADPPDPHHLYHLDEPWFRTEYEAAGFELIDRLDLTSPKPGTFLTLRAA